MSVVFLALSSWAVISGYRRRAEREPPGAAQTVIASIPDMGAVRHLSDVCVRLAACVESLEAAARDGTHHTRNLVDEIRALTRAIEEQTKELRDIR